MSAPAPIAAVAKAASTAQRAANRCNTSQTSTTGTTIAGLVIHEAQTIPNPGQAFTFHGYRFEVLRRQRNRLTSLQVTPLAEKVAAKAEAINVS